MKKKTGINTSEFKLAVAAIIGVTIDKYFGINLPQGTIIEVVGLVMAYVVSRGMAKTENRS